MEAVVRTSKCTALLRKKVHVMNVAIILFPNFTLTLVYIFTF